MFSSLHSLESIFLFIGLITFVFVYGLILASRSRLKLEAFALRKEGCSAYKISIHSIHAKCIDGSPPAYYFRPGEEDGAKKWHIHFIGGAWCSNLKACSLRSKSNLGSSLNYPKCLDDTAFTGTYLEKNKETNPILYNYNTVVVKYCDGGSYAGNTEREYNGTTLYFRGLSNRNAVIEDLLTRKGMNEAVEVVISGCSAGALGVLMSIDDITSTIRAVTTGVRVLGLIDSGFFLDYTSPLSMHRVRQSARPHKTNSIKVVQGSLDYAAHMRDVSELMNISAGVPSLCRHQYKTDMARTRCLFAENLLPFIETPIFMLQSKYDHWMIWNVIGDPSVVELVNQFGNNVTRLMKTALIKKNKVKSHAIFIDSCTHHCYSCSAAEEVIWHGHSILSHELITPSEAFSEWHRTLLNQRVSRVFAQESVYPCLDCCKCRAQ